MSRLDDRVVIVSATELDVARVLAAEGAAVVIVGTDGPALAEAVAAIGASGARLVVFAGDLGDPDARRALAELVGELFP